MSGNVKIVLEQDQFCDPITTPDDLVDHDASELSGATGEKNSELLKPISAIDHLKDGDGTSSLCTSEEEGSHPEISDEGSTGKYDREEAEFVTPDEELIEKIIKQVEFYFSDVNLLKDAFLLKHVRRNKQGFVSIKLITSFKKVKSLTKDYRVVAHSLTLSDKLELNDECKKVRRKDPLPEYDETTPSRSVVAVNLPMETPSIESVAEIFNKCGEVALIRILRPGKPVPQDVKKHSMKHPEIGSTICAVVEFETHESAKMACDLMNDTDNWRKGMRVVLLASANKHKKKDKSESLNGTPGSDEDSSKDERKRRRGGRRKNRVDELASRRDDSSCCSSGSDGDVSPSPHAISKPIKASPSPNRLDQDHVNRLSPSTSPRSSPISSPRNRRGKHHGKSPLADSSPGTSPRNSPRSSPEMMRKKLDHGSSGESSPSSPWVQRRLKAAQSPLVDSSTSPTGSPGLARRNMDSGRMKDMAGVVRQPRGPDGTNGFQMGRGKQLTAVAS